MFLSLPLLKEEEKQQPQTGLPFNQKPSQTKPPTAAALPFWLAPRPKAPPTKRRPTRRACPGHLQRAQLQAHGLQQRLQVIDPSDRPTRSDSTRRPSDSTRGLRSKGFQKDGIPSGWWIEGFKEKPFPKKLRKKGRRWAAGP